MAKKLEFMYWMSLLTRQRVPWPYEKVKQMFKKNACVLNLFICDAPQNVIVTS